MIVEQDDAYERRIQPEIDDAAEAHRALFAGKEAGRMNAAAGTNPHHPTEQRVQYDAWERGRINGMTSKPVACHSCTHLYFGAVCPICKEERPAYTALKSMERA